MELSNPTPSPAVSQCQPLEINGSYFIGSEQSSLLLPITEKQYAAMTENK